MPLLQEHSAGGARTLPVIEMVPDWKRSWRAVSCDSHTTSSMEIKAILGVKVADGFLMEVWF